MQNIDPIIFLTPIIVMAFSFGLPIYWRSRGRFTRHILIYSLLAYGIAIALKIVLQEFTIGPFLSYVGENLPAIGLYYGLQTVVFEVGLAYVFAYYAVSRKSFGRNDAVGYGLGLAMWENGVLISTPLLVNYVTYFIVLSSGGTAAQQLFDLLRIRSPSLFLAPSQVLPLIGYSILERISSLLVHLSWGYLCVLSAVSAKRSLFVAALPMGMIDFFVVYTSVIGVATFELTLFLIGLLCIGVAFWLGRRTPKEVPKTAAPPSIPLK
jgi:hypothetical protein